MQEYQKFDYYIDCDAKEDFFLYLTNCGVTKKFFVGSLEKIFFDFLGIDDVDFGLSYYSEKVGSNDFLVYQKGIAEEILKTVVNKDEFDILTNEDLENVFIRDTLLQSVKILQEKPYTKIIQKNIEDKKNGQQTLQL